MEDGCYKIVLAGRYGVGKSTIFSKLKEDWSGETVEELTGLSGRGNDKWTVTVNSSAGKEIMVCSLSRACVTVLLLLLIIILLLFFSN